MYVRFLENAEVDGLPKPSQVTSDVMTSKFVTYTLPHFWNYAIIDPGMQKSREGERGRGGEGERGRGGEGERGRGRRIDILIDLQITRCSWTWMLTHSHRKSHANPPVPLKTKTRRATPLLSYPLSPPPSLPPSLTSSLSPLVPLSSPYSSLIPLM